MTPAPKRRWFRFSLRTLFVVLTVCALCSPAIVKQYKDWKQRCDVKELIELITTTVTMTSGPWDQSEPPDDPASGQSG